MSSFQSSYDATAKAVTSLALGAITVVALASHSDLAVGVGLAILILGYAWSPSGYEISDGYVVVRRLFGNVRIPVSEIRDVRVATTDDLRWSFRLIGSGGLFGYYGLFRNSKLGTCRWYVTDRSKAVVLVTGERPAVISPDDVDGFLAAMGKKTGIEYSPVLLDNGRAPNLLVAALILIPVAVVIAAFAYSPGLTPYRLTPASLTIQDKFYPVTVNASSVDVNSVRVVDINEDSGWKPVRRTNGFSNTHYHSGWYKLENGEEVRMYRADGSRLVLLPPKGNGTPVLIQAAQPDAFVSQVRQEWK
jgi:hypothetical protein